MQYFRTIWRVGSCVLAFSAAQGFSQAAATAPAAQSTTSQPVPAADPSGNKTAAPIIPGLTNLPTSQAGPPQSPSNQPVTSPAGLHISSGDLLDVNVYGVP